MSPGICLLLYSSALGLQAYITTLSISTCVWAADPVSSSWHGSIFLTELSPQPSPNSSVPKDPCTSYLCLAPSSSRCLRGWLSSSSFRPLPKYFHREVTQVAVTFCQWVLWCPCLLVHTHHAVVSLPRALSRKQKERKGRNFVCLS